VSAWIGKRWRRWLFIWIIGGALMWWNVTAGTYLERSVSVFLVAWLAAFEAALRPS
jgi:hypothetical protein